MWFSTGGERVRQTLEDAFAWCDQCGVVSDAPSADEHGDAFWVQIGLHAQQVRAAILSNLESGDPELLRALHGSGCVRRFVDGTRARGHFVWFERGDELRLLLAPGALRASTVAGPGLWLYWGGPSSGMADGLKAAFEECWSSSIPVSPADSVGGLPPASTVTPYSRPIERFLNRLPTYRKYQIERVALAPEVPEPLAKRFRDRGWLVEDLRTLTCDLM